MAVRAVAFVLWAILLHRLREQEWGNFQDANLFNNIAQERLAVGRFWYRFSTGESGADVFGRADSFLDTLYRTLDAVAVGRQVCTSIWIMLGYDPVISPHTPPHPTPESGGPEEPPPPGNVALWGRCYRAGAAPATATSRRWVASHGLYVSLALVHFRGGLFGVPLGQVPRHPVSQPTKQ